MQLYHGDCLDKLKLIPDGSVDMVLADLPFGTTENAWDKKIPFAPLWEQLNRVCKTNAAMLFFAQFPFAAELCMSNRKMFRYEWIWQKSNKTGFLNANRMPLKAHENILVFYRRLPTYNPQMVKGEAHTRGKSGNYSTNYGKFIRLNGSKSNLYYPTDILTHQHVFHSGEEQVHPTQKPVPLLEYLIKT
ncbi:MAG: site-specific DNA-methyltransferase, partial [Abditibacteriota bacterium]|nr:site-specific DNA-methyltransferase [Abditibacteriota bacterium]